MSIIDKRATARFENQKEMYKRLYEEESKQNNNYTPTAAATGEAWSNKENDIIGAKDAPKLTQNSNKGNYQTPAQRARQNISDNVAEKAGAEEDVFDKIAKDHLEEMRKELASESKRWSGFGEEILNALKEGNDRINNKQTNGKIVVPQKGYGSRANWYAETPEEYLARYNAAEDYVMSDGENMIQNVAKGTFNRFRSAPGEAVEDLAYLLKDYLPWYKPAQNVVDKNVAGNIGNTATGQFGLAKNETGYFGDRLIDAADSAASMLGYATVFGPANLALSQSIGGGIDEYRYQRENGSDKSEALVRGAGTGLISYVIERLGGLGADNSIAPKVNLRDTISTIKAMTKTALQEGGEEAAEYTANSLMNYLADAIYKGKVSIDWNAEDAFNSAVTGAIVGGGLAAVPVVNGRDIDIVEDMHKIVNEKTDVDTKIENAQKLKDSLGWRKKAEKEVDNLLYYLKKDKAKGVNNITRNAWGKPITEINHGVVIGAPNSITEVINKKGGAVRNYYNNGGLQYKQVANNNENHALNNLDNGGIHAHDYYLNEKGIPAHGKVRRMNVKEILENEGWI